MRFRSILSLFALAALLLAACDDSMDNLGKEIQPSADEIIVRADTFHLASETLPMERIISRPDSFLLGEFYDKTLGITKADILAEVLLPKEGFTFLSADKAVTNVDSVTMTLVFNSYFGRPNSPIHVSVYELSDTLNRNENYQSDMDPTPWVDKSKPIGGSLFTVQDGANITTQVRFHLTEQFKQRFFTTNPLHYKNQNEFRKFFPGMYITTDVGAVTLLNVRHISISMYYHYAYTDRPDEKINGRHDYFVTPEVKRVNRILHPIQAQVLASLKADEAFNDIAAPANYYTQVRIPLERIRQRVKVAGKEVLTINSSSIKLNVKQKTAADESLIPYINNLLLIKKDSLKSFFSNRKPLSETYAFFAKKDSVYISQSNYKYEYNFNGLAKLIEQEVKKTENTEPYLDMVLVPVTPMFQQIPNSREVTVSEVNESNLMQSVRIYSGKNTEIPMKMEVIYSGF